jgi:hypothetical protein
VLLPALVAFSCESGTPACDPETLQGCGDDPVLGGLCQAVCTNGVWSCSCLSDGYGPTGSQRACNNASDCPDAQVCCRGASSSFACSPSCSYDGGLQACATSDECPAGEICLAAFGALSSPTFRLCLLDLGPIDGSLGAETGLAEAASQEGSSDAGLLDGADTSAE